MKLTRYILPAVIAAVLASPVRADVADWSTTAASNTTLEGVSWAEGMSPANVNNGVRAVAAALKAWSLDLGGENSAGGTGDAITLTTDSVYASLIDGLPVCFTATATNTGAATFNLDTLGAQDIKKYTTSGLTALAAGDITSGGRYCASYETTNADWILQNPLTVSISAGVSGLASGIATFLGTPSSANLATAVTDETGSGALVFGTSPTITTGLELGHATDTTLARSGAGVVTIEGVEVTTNTGTQTLTNKTLTSPTMTTPTLGVATATSVDVGNADTTVSRSAAGVLAVEGVILSTQEVICVAMSDEITTITTGTAKVTMRWPFAMTVTAVRASVNTASSSGTPTVDINDGGTTIMDTTKLTIDANEETSTTAAAAAVLSDTALADDAEVTFDIDVAGTGTKGLKVCVYGNRA